MGFFDTVKQKAGVIAGDAERAARVTAAQARLVVLQNDVRKAERDLGQAAFELIERGELAPDGLEEGVARLRAVLGEIRDKDAEIARLRGTHAAEGTPVEAEAPAVAEAPAEAPAEAAGEAPAEAEAVVPTAAEVPAAEGDQTAAETPAKKPAAKATGTRRAPAKKASAKTAPGKKPSAKKAPAAARKAATAKPAAKKTAKQAGGKEKAAPANPSEDT